MVTQRVKLDGKSGTAVFLTAKLELAVSKAAAEVVKVVFDDKSVWFGVRSKRGVRARA